MPVAKPAAPRIACAGCFQEVDVTGLAPGGGVVCRRCGAFNRIRAGEVVEKPVSADLIRAASVAAAERTAAWTRRAAAGAAGGAAVALGAAYAAGGGFGLLVGAPAAVAAASLLLLFVRRYRDAWTLGAVGAVSAGIAFLPLVALGAWWPIGLAAAGLAAAAVPFGRRILYPLR